MEGDMCLDPGMDQKLSIINIPSASSFSKLQGERVEQID